MLETDALEPNMRASMRTYPIVSEFLRQHAQHPARSFLGRLFGLNPLPVEARSLYRGAVGELVVVDAISQLGPEWLVLHSVPVAKDGGHVDHIVIGPPGVYTVAVRNQVGQATWVGGSVVLVDGERVPHIRDAEFEAVRAAQLLSDAVGTRVEVTPCLVIVDPRSLTVARPPERVAILTPRELRQWLKRLPAVYSAEQLGDFRTAAAERATWSDPRRPDSGGSGDIAGYLEQFRALQREVLAARRLRLTWITGGLILVWLVAFVGFAIGLLLG